MKNKVFNSITFGNYNTLLLSMVILLLLFAPRFVPIALTGWSFFSLLYAGLNKIQPKFKVVQILLIAFYILYIIGGIWSENTEVWSFHLEVKMALILLPIVFAFIDLSFKQLRWLSLIFISGLSLHFLLLFIKAVIMVKNTGSTDWLFYTELSPKIHPAYYAFYVNIAISIVLVDLYNNKLQLFRKKWVSAFVILMLACANIFLLSKMGIVTTLLLCMCLLIYWIRAKKYILVLLIVLGAFGSAYTIYLKSAYVQWRVKEMVEALQGGHEDNYIYSTSLRIAVWEIAKDKYLERPVIGYGPGDVKDVLYEAYVERELRKAPELHLNAHNQFLETALGLGMIGLIVLSSILILPIVQYRKNNYYGALIGVVTLLFFLSESVLETQAGVIGFVLFFVLFTTQGLKDTTENEKIVVEQ